MFKNDPIWFTNPDYMTSYYIQNIDKGLYTEKFKEDIVEKFYQKIKSIHAKKQKNLRGNQKLADLRDWLLRMVR